MSLSDERAQILARSLARTRPELDLYLMTENCARYVIGTQVQYDDGVWTYPWIWALYLLKTGDLSFVKANFAHLPVRVRPAGG